MRPFGFDNTYARELPGFYAPWQPAPAPAPRLLFLNEALADELGLDTAALRGETPPTRHSGLRKEVGGATAKLALSNGSAGRTSS